jgi:hypothetical protein
MSTNPFRDYAAFAWQICEEERKRDLSPDRLRRPLGEMQRHITEREIALQQHRNAALAAGRKTGHDQSEVEQRVVALCEQCRKLLLWEKDAPRLTAEQLRERQQSACCTGDPAGVYLVNLINAFWALWEKVNDLAAAYDGSAERPLRERTAGQSGAKQPEGAGAGRDPAGGEQAEGMPDSDPWFDLRARFPTDPAHIEVLRERLNSEEAADLDRITHFACVFFHRPRFTGDIFERLDPWLRLQVPGVDLWELTLKQVADLLEEATTPKGTAKTGQAEGVGTVDDPAADLNEASFPLPSSRPTGPIDKGRSMSADKSLPQQIHNFVVAVDVCQEAARRLLNVFKAQ